MATLKQTTRKSINKATKAAKRTVTRLTKKVSALVKDQPKAIKRSRRVRRRPTTKQAAKQTS